MIKKLIPSQRANNATSHGQLFILHVQLIAHTFHFGDKTSSLRGNLGQATTGHSVQRLIGTALKLHHPLAPQDKVDAEKAKEENEEEGHNRSLTWHDGGSEKKRREATFDHHSQTHFDISVAYD
ncbi:hypothetical protein TYRP_008508 [Tyrophagus putrescentiae]|nr:hypothetical protein TYRP_008508 [Tyrophagus putrescentiae]